MKKLVKTMGEFGLIKKIRASLKTDRSVFKGIGDDAAVINYTKDKFLLFTCDMLLEGVHFDLKKASFREVGRKALAASISDIAAMGGLPRWAVVSIGLPGNLTENNVKEIYEGINSVAKKNSVNIVGGDTIKSERLVIDIALIGEVEKKYLTLRSGAKVGDLIFVTGFLGGSISSKHLTFTPRVEESRILVKHFGINSLIDISDGLAGDLKRILEESKVGAVISEHLIPLSKKAKSVRNALSDGEDFELLFTAGESEARKIMKLFPRYSKTKISIIGKIMPVGFGYKIIKSFGKIEDILDKGFEHF